MQQEIELLSDDRLESENGPATQGGFVDSHPGEEDLLDAYSRAVITAAEKVSISAALERMPPAPAKTANSHRLTGRM